MATYSFLNLVNICDNFRVRSSTEALIPFVFISSNVTRSSNNVIGLLRPEVFSRMLEDDDRHKGAGSPDIWEYIPPTSPGGRISMSFHSSLDTPAKRSLAMKELCERWRNEGIFADVIGGRMWRDELYPVYCNPFGPHDDENLAFVMERAACALFGVVTYGVHMTIYHTPDLRIWVPQRAKTKQTWPGFLDNSVAGGMTAGMGALETIIKEAAEEASIPEDIVRTHAKSAGSISYFFQTAKGWLQPEIEYVYDLCIPEEDGVSAFEPRPSDGEVESFELLPLDQVVFKMRRGLFKPNTALVLIDFLIRHGHMTPDNEPDFMEIITRLHGRFDFGNGEGWLA